MHRWFTPTAYWSIYIFLTGGQQRQIQSIVADHFIQIHNKGILIIMEQKSKMPFWKNFPHQNLFGSSSLPLKKRLVIFVRKHITRSILQIILCIFVRVVFSKCLYPFVLLHNSVIQGKRPEINCNSSFTMYSDMEIFRHEDHSDLQFSDWKLWWNCIFMQTKRH